MTLLDCSTRSQETKDKGEKMLILFLFLAFSLPLIFLLLLLPKHTKNAPFRPPPGPKGLPLIGNLHQFDASTPHLYLSNLAKIYGPVLALRLPRPTVVIQSAKAAEEVLKTQDHNFCSRPQLVGPRKLSYNGLDMIFAPYNEYFKEIKKICFVHLLGSKKVRSFSPIRQEEVSRLINKISSLISSGSDQVVNLSELLMSFSFSNISRIAFGKRYEDDEWSTRSRFFNLLDEAQILFSAFFFADYLPCMGWLDKLIGQSSNLERVFNELDKLYEEVINEHLDPNNRTSKQEEDILDVLLQLREESVGSSAFQLTLDHVKAVLMNIFVGGTTTTVATIVWTMTELVKNPTAMRKVQDEITNMAKNKSFITEDDLEKLEYLKAVVKETFRLYPGVPLLVIRETLRKCSIQGYDIEPKTLVHVNAWAIGRDPESWEEPDVFKPERFLGSSITYKGQDFMLIPFGSGRRMCPGMQLGVANIELALANLLYSFDWDLPPGVNMDTDALPGVVMHKKNPLCLVPKKISMLIKES